MYELITVGSFNSKIDGEFQTLQAAIDQGTQLIEQLPSGNTIILVITEKLIPYSGRVKIPVYSIIP